jgi:hypothetical protein
MLVVAILGVSTFGYLTWRANQPPVLTFCEGIGLLAGPAESSPRRALDAYFVSRGGAPSDPEVWRERDSDDGASATFENTKYEGRLVGKGFRSIQVQRGTSVPGSTVAADQWTVQGACL